MKFTLATCVRNEGPYLLEWVAHHRLLGFERIVIYSNDNNDGSDDLLMEMQTRGLIEWRPRTLESGESPQMSAFRKFSKELFDNPQELGGYIAWFDCDEFLVLKMHSTVQELMEFYRYPDALFINWKHFGSSGIKKFSYGLTISRFLRCSSNTYHNKQIKSITRIDKNLYKLLSNHRPFPINENSYGRIIYPSCDSAGTPVSKELVYGVNAKTMSDAPVFFDICQLNHYAIRSEQEYKWKECRGNGLLSNDSNKRHFFAPYFKDHDLNDELDTFANEKYANNIRLYLDSLPSKLKELEFRIINNLA